MVIDDLSTGHRDAVKGALFIHGDIGDSALVLRVVEPKASMPWFISPRSGVAESVENRALYYDDNAGKTTALLACCTRASIKHFVFASTAAVYGLPDGGVADEEMCPRPCNPYGISKLVTERDLRAGSITSTMRHVVLRYFNVAGCDPRGGAGQSTPQSTLLVKVACEHAAGNRPYVAIHGINYDTKDGTAVRDYIHVEDVAEANVLALDHLRRGGKSLTLNCGSGRGYSVREVLDAVARQSRRALRITECTPRFGHVSVLVSCNEKLRSELGWIPRFDGLDLIVQSSLAWEQRHAIG